MSREAPPPPPRNLGGVGSGGDGPLSPRESYGPNAGPVRVLPFPVGSMGLRPSQVRQQQQLNQQEAGGGQSNGGSPRLPPLHAPSPSAVSANERNGFAHQLRHSVPSAASSSGERNAGPFNGRALPARGGHEPDDDDESEVDEGREREVADRLGQSSAGHDNPRGEPLSQFPISVCYYFCSKPLNSHAAKKNPD